MEKTWICVRYISDFARERRISKIFQAYRLICPTVADNLAYQNRKWIWNDDRVYINDSRDSTLHETIEIYHETLKGDETLFIIDDCSATKELKYRKHENDNKCMISELGFNGRHANHSSWIISQKYNSVLKYFREQLKWLWNYEFKIDPVRALPHWNRGSLCQVTTPMRGRQ